MINSPKFWLSMTLFQVVFGLAVDPTHQRIWLTLGFVSSQLGNTEQARTALTTAIELGPTPTLDSTRQKCSVICPGLVGQIYSV